MRETAAPLVQHASQGGAKTDSLATQQMEQGLVGIDEQWDEEAALLVRSSQPHRMSCAWRAGPLTYILPVGRQPTLGLLAAVACLGTCAMLLRHGIWLTA